MNIFFANPRKLPKPAQLKGRVVVLDIAFASEASGTNSFQKITKAFIDGLGKRLIAWVDHHDSTEHARYRDDERFVLCTKAQHGACPEIITPELVESFLTPDTIVCHSDFDGLVSAAKWQRRGREPYPGADADAYAIDTRIGQPSAVAERIDRAIRARPRDLDLMHAIVQLLASGLTDEGLWKPINAAAAEMAAIEETTRDLARHYARLAPGVALVDITPFAPPVVDKTLLLLLGQELERVSIVIDRDTVTLAAAFDSGLNFLTLLGLSGGMPTRVSVPVSRLDDIWRALGVDPQLAEDARRPPNATAAPSANTPSPAPSSHHGGSSEPIIDSDHRGRK